jgi:hypothetical protein
MSPATVTDKDVLAIWMRLQQKRSKVRIRKAKFSVGQHVRISEEIAKFAKSAEQNHSTEVFSIIEVIPRTPRPVYGLEDLNKQPIDGQFYEEVLAAVRITEQNQFQLDKIMATRVKRGIKEHLVRWKGYSKVFENWIPASYITHI